MKMGGKKDSTETSPSTNNTAKAVPKTKSTMENMPGM
jgi:hypothetical protein